MVDAKGVRKVGYIDCAGGGQVVVERGRAYVGHMRSPHGTSIFDVRDPRNPSLLASLEMPAGTHSHKVRLQGDVMIINREVNHADTGLPAEFRGGLGIFDVSIRGGRANYSNGRLRAPACTGSMSMTDMPTFPRPWKAIAEISF